MKNKLTNVLFYLRKKLIINVMKTFILLFSSTIFAFTSGTIFSQNAKIIIESEKTVTVDEVFDIIRNQTNYTFIYQEDLFKNIPKVHLKKGVIRVNELLKASIPNEEYNINFTKDNTLVINQKTVEPKADFFIQQKISGRVSDSNGLPMPGVSIVEKGTNNGVVTDISGNYSLIVNNTNAVLLFSYIGFQPQELALKNVTNFTSANVTLKESVTSLNQVVVTGYQTLAVERTVGSFEKVGAKQLEQRPSSANFIDRLTGQVAGLNVNPVNKSFEIRGRSTILNDFANPLIIVDGFPLTDQRNFESINPEDIESVTLLKDASASSIWGSRASNGVVVVVTKKGYKNKALTVDFSSFLEIENKVDLSDNHWMSSSQEINLDTEFIDKKWVDLNALARGNASINDFHLANIYRNGFSPDGTIWSQSTYDNYINKLKQNDVNRDWEKYLLRNSIRNTYNLSISGGGDRNTFFGSLSYTDKLDPSIGDENNRFSMNLRNVYEFNDKVSFTAGLTATLRNQEENGLESFYGVGAAGGSATLAGFAQAYDALMDENGQYIQRYHSWNPWVSKSRETLVGAPYTYNPIEEQRARDASRTLVDVRADFKLDIEIVKDLKFISSFRYERNTNDFDYFKSMDMPSQRNLINDYYVLEAGKYVNKIPRGTEYLKESTYSRGWIFNNSLTWDKKWNNHELTVFGGGEYSSRFTELYRNRQFGYDKKSTTFLPINEVDLLSRQIRNWAGGVFSKYTDRQIFDVDNQDNRFVSVYSNLGYTYNKKYTLNGSFRIDQANIYGSNPDFRYKPLWSAGVAWDATKESFLEKATWINRLKLRASYGLGGNSIANASPYPTARIRNITWGNPYVSLTLGQPANADLKWEETTTTDFGVDFAFLKNRISGSIDYYYKKSTDVYTSRTLDPTVGFTSAMVNYADIDNKGIELVLNADIIRSKNFNWSVRANFNTNQNEIVNFKSPGVQTADAYTGGVALVVGQPIAPLYGYNFAGLDNNGEVLLYDKDGNTKSWRGFVSTDELVYKGSRTPQHYGGLSTTFRYKGFDLTANLNYQADFVFKDSYNYASAGFGTDNNVDNDFGNLRMHEIWDQRWRQAGDELNTGVPKVFYNGLNPITGIVENRFDTSSMHRIWNQSTYTMHKGDYIRVQDIILGYTIPSEHLKSTFFQNLRFTTQVTNPFLWVANDLGIDPTAINAEAYSNLIRFTFGLRATF
jgi:TonB-linked SusC/RagA family outer membrane protein